MRTPPHRRRRDLRHVHDAFTRVVFGAFTVAVLMILIALVAGIVHSIVT